LESEARRQELSDVVLSAVAVAAGVSRDKSALDLIPFLLPKASNSLQLGTLLRRHPLVSRDAKHIFCSEKREAVQAAEHCLKVNMDLSNFVRMLYADVLALGLREAKCYACISEPSNQERNQPSDGMASFE
jgi:hypothetical protein